MESLVGIGKTWRCTPPTVHPSTARFPTTIRQRSLFVASLHLLNTLFHDLCASFTPSPRSWRLCRARELPRLPVEPGDQGMETKRRKRIVRAVLGKPRDVRDPHTYHSISLIA